MAGESKPAKRSTQAPGQYYGYSLQTTRMLARLLACREGEAVSLEVLDDVGVAGADRPIAEQDKSGLAHNPIADRSVDLWKTLFNWVESIREGALIDGTCFILYVAQPYSGPIAGRINAVKSMEEAGAELEDLRNKFWGEAPGRPKKAVLPVSIAPYVNGVLEADDAVLQRLMVAFELQTGSGSPGDDIRDLLLNAPIGASAVEHVLETLLGWLKRQVDSAIESGRSAVVPYDDFHAKYVATAKKFDRSDALAPSPADISDEQIDRELRSRVYVTQLKLISLGENDLVRAVNDYLRASSDRVAWSEAGDVIESSLEDFMESLQRKWENSQTLAHLEDPRRSEIDQGRVVHAKCMDYAGRLQGMDVPSYFTPGSFHVLADERRIGWHRRFIELLKAQAEGDDFSGNAEDEAVAT